MSKNQSYKPIKIQNMAGKIGFFSLVFLVIFILSATKSSAQRKIESERYRIDFIPFSAETKESVTVVQEEQLREEFQNDPVALGFSKNGYFIKTGFPDVTSTTPFQFSINPLVFAFDQLLPGKKAFKASALSATLGSAQGYTVMIHEEKPLSNTSGAQIPSTTCNTPKAPCFPENAAPWTKIDRYGLGYQLSGADFSPDFVGKNYFRPLPDKSQGVNPVPIMKGIGYSDTRTAIIRMKLVLNPSQQSGIYTNNINITALPRY